MAKYYFEKHPIWKDWKFQMDVLAEWATNRYFNKYEGNIFKTVVAHNCPACANRNADSSAGYWKKVLRLQKLLTLK